VFLPERSWRDLRRLPRWRAGGDAFGAEAMSHLPERKPPTHVLRIEIPLNMNNGKGNFDPIQDAIQIALSLSRAAYVGSICDTPSLSLRETGACPECGGKDWRGAIDGPYGICMGCGFENGGDPAYA
jgi:hypothetical protein